MKKMSAVQGFGNETFSEQKLSIGLVRLITKSNRRRDDRLARTLTRQAQIDPERLGLVRYRSAHAQIHLTVICGRAELMRLNRSNDGRLCESRMA